MEQDSIKTLINKAIIANRNNDYNHEKDIIKNISRAINEDIYLFEKTNEIDIHNNNGFKLDYYLINKILNKYQNINPKINENDEIKLTKNENINSKIYTKLGVLLVIFDGNTYTMLEMILLGILTHNTIIFTSNGYMGGTNGLLISIVEAILEKEKLEKEMFQQSVTIRSKEFFNNFKTINKTIIIGDNNFTSKYIKECTTEVLISGYKNYDIYIDSLNNLDLLEKIVTQFGNNTDVYINSSLNINYDNGIFVNDIDEAIAKINFNSSKYSSAIFTENKANASKFIKNIDSKFVMVNASPTLEQSLDITQEDLLKEKNIIMPNIYKEIHS